jgi:hypothetical protein
MIIDKLLEAYYCEIAPTQSAKIFSVRKSSDLKMIVINRKLINYYFFFKMHILLYVTYNISRNQKEQINFSQQLTPLT